MNSLTVAERGIERRGGIFAKVEGAGWATARKIVWSVNEDGGSYGPPQGIESELDATSRHAAARHFREREKTAPRLLSPA